MKIRNRYSFNHLTPIFFIYYFGKIFGLLPIGYYRLNKHNPNDEGEFRPSKSGLLFCILQFVVEAWTCYIVIKYLLESAMMRNEALCSQGNFCTAFGLLLSHTIIAILVILIVPLRYRSTISCFNQANHILFSKRHKRIFTRPYYTLLPFTLCILLKILISNIGFYIREPELYYPYNLAYFGPIIIINVVGVLCSICEHAFQDINKELEHLCESSHADGYRIQRVDSLMEEHWFVTNYLDNISKCFSLDIFLIMTDIYIQLVLFLYVTLWSMFAQKVFSGSIWPHAAGLLEVMIISVKLIYLCYRCDRAVAQGSLTIFHLQHLNSVTSYNLEMQHLIKIFTLKVNCRDVTVSACGFFTINLSLLVRIIGVVLTYFLVLIQFQVDGETSLQTRQSKTKCASWPCLKPS